MGRRGPEAQGQRRDLGTRLEEGCWTAAELVHSNRGGRGFCCSVVVLSKGCTGEAPTGGGGGWGVMMMGPWGVTPGTDACSDPQGHCTAGGPASRPGPAGHVKWAWLPQHRPHFSETPNRRHGFPGPGVALCLLERMPGLCRWPFSGWSPSARLEGWRTVTVVTRAGKDGGEVGCLEAVPLECPVGGQPGTKGGRWSRAREPRGHQALPWDSSRSKVC